MKYTIGADFGTLSARAVLAETETGRVISEEVMPYPHGVIDASNPCGLKISPKASLADPTDYMDALINVIQGAVKKSGVHPDDIIGIAVDATSCSILPLDINSQPLCLQVKFQKNPHAYIKLWKHFDSVPYAERLNDAATELQETLLHRYGYKAAGEWMFSKLLEILDKAPEVDAETCSYAEVCDWLTSLLTGELCRSRGAAGYKALWSPDEGYPKESLLNRLHPALAEIVHNKLSGKIVSYGSKAGSLCESMAKKLGLNTGIAVAAGIVDGHAPVPAIGLQSSGDLSMGVGTSTTMMYINDVCCEIPGIAGVLKDGLLPGFYGYVAGQNAVGDLFEWCASNCVPEEYASEAREHFISPIALMSEKAALLQPGESGLVALDWWSGNRSILKNSDLTGLILGFTLKTKPEEIYRALVEATAFGARRIIEHFEESGLEVKRIFACGGIAYKDMFLMQTYADILQREILVSKVLNCAALGSAICAAAAAGEEAGGYGTLSDAVTYMAQKNYIRYSPSASCREPYELLYRKYTYLHNLFGVENPSFMKELRG